MAARFRPRIALLAILVLAGGMPSLEHAALVEMFRTNPRLLPYLLREVFHMPVPEALTITIAEAALDQVKPIEFRADLVLELRDPNQGSPQLAAILEVQLGPDEDKRYSWPAYLILGRSRHRCETCVIVLAPDPAVAVWAQRPIRIGPGNELRVHVLGPAEIPIVHDPAALAAFPELAVLAAIAHGNEPEGGPRVLQRAMEALDALDNKDAEIYLHLIYKALGEPMRAALRNIRMLRERFPDVKLEFPGFIHEALDNSEARGKVKGELHGRAVVLLKILDHGRVALTPEQREHIETCDSQALLDAWVERAFAAKTAAELFG